MVPPSLPARPPPAAAPRNIFGLFRRERKPFPPRQNPPESTLHRNSMTKKRFCPYFFGEQNSISLGSTPPPSLIHSHNVLGNGRPLLPPPAPAVPPPPTARISRTPRPRTMTSSGPLLALRDRDQHEQCIGRIFLHQISLSLQYHSISLWGLPRWEIFRRAYFRTPTLTYSRVDRYGANDEMFVSIDPTLTHSIIVIVRHEAQTTQRLRT